MRYATVLFHPKQKADVPHSSGIYGPGWAEKLYRGLERNTSPAWYDALHPLLTVVTDYADTEWDADISVRAAPFEYPDRDWSSLMEMFRPDVVGDGAILLGLDTIITGSLDAIEEACKGRSCIAPLDPYYAPKICNAAVYVDGDVAADIWEKWQVGRWAYMQQDEYKMWGRFSEMVWLRKHLPVDKTWDELVPGAIQSYKVHLNSGPPKASTKMVYFHGSPKPHEVNQPWIEEHWG